MNKNSFNLDDRVTVLKKKDRVGEIVGLRRWTHMIGDFTMNEWIYWVAFDDDSVEKHEASDLNRCNKIK